MRGRFAFLITGLAVASLVASTPATARPIDKGHFHDVFTSDVYDCDGTPAQDSGDVSRSIRRRQSPRRCPCRRPPPRWRSSGKSRTSNRSPD